MPLFQQSVVKKYINDLNETELQAVWQLAALEYLKAEHKILDELTAKMLGEAINCK